MRPIRLLPLFLLAAACDGPRATSPTALALSATLQVPVVADTTIQPSPANTNHGTTEEIKVGYGGARNSRALVRVDDAALRTSLDGKRLVAARLEVQIHDSSSWGMPGRNLAAYRMTMDWGETTATWTCARYVGGTCQAPWSMASSPPYATPATAIVVPTGIAPEVASLDVTADVRAFLAGTPNRGWLLRKTNESLTGDLWMGSRESDHPPRLVLEIEATSCATARVDDGNPCTLDACDPNTGISHTPVAAGTACSDGNACNGAETCDAVGTCRAGTAPALDDGNACTTDSCDPATGPVHAPLAAGTECSDGNACNGSEACNADGQCIAGAPPALDDGNPCTTDSCDPATGTVHTPAAAGVACSDGNVCNGAESCNGAGQCAGGTPLALDDGNPCTADVCDPTTGVAHVPLAAGLSCADANACDGAETCDGAGRCVAGPPPSLDDGNACTEDRCDPVRGIHHDLMAGCGPPPDPATLAPPIVPGVATSVFAATEFLYAGATPIQTGVAPGTIDKQRAALVRGRVAGRGGVPIPMATIDVLAHPEYGSTQSRADGQYDLVVNGGEPIVLRIRAAGHPPAQRRVAVGWEQTRVVDDVVLIDYDAATTTVTPNAVAMEVARGTAVTDVHGTRQATLMVPPGTRAQMRRPDGSLQDLGQLTLRFSEFTVGAEGPAAMPASLPPASAYTYAVDISADEVLGGGVRRAGTDVILSQPVPYYLENFLALPVGTPVPAGYYDDDQGQWVASDSGIVLRILGVEGDVATVDSDGDGAADVPTGMTELERRQLAALYAPGQTLWRVALPHFSIWDLNMGFEAPPWAKFSKLDLGNDGSDCQSTAQGSIIGCEDQTLGERFGVAGTPFELAYQSERVPGRKTGYRIRVPVGPLSACAHVASFKRTADDPNPCGNTIEIEVAGRKTRYEFRRDPFHPEQQEREVVFDWDGKDAFGRTLEGIQPVTVRLANVYAAYYTRTARFGRSGPAITTNETRDLISLWTEWHGGIGGWDARDQGLGGLTVSPHHHYDPFGQTLFRGDGSRRSAGSVRRVVTTALGSGNSALLSPGASAVAADGTVYVVHRYGNSVLRLQKNRGASVFAGGNGAGSAGDGGPATAAQLNGPGGLALGPDGAVYVAEEYGHRVRRIDPVTGIITTVAGTGVSGTGGDSGPATAARIGAPKALAVDSAGNLYIAQSASVASRIRRVDTDGLVSTFAGGVTAYSGDGGQAANSGLRSPGGLAVGPDGSVYIADTGNHAVRRVTPDGIIRTLAGGNGPGFLGDGNPATGAQLSSPEAVAVERDGRVLVADTGNRRIRSVSPDGTILTIAGQGATGYSGDGGQPTAATFRRPWALSLGPDGSLYISDWESWRLRKIAPALPGTSVDDITIASEDGGLLYRFDAGGRHLATIDTRTRATLYAFAYDSASRLSSITDVDGGVTRIERDAAGRPTAIVAPRGQRTGIGVDASGFVSNLSDEAGGTITLVCDDGGLLQSMSGPRPGSEHRFRYDVVGRLLRDEDPAGGFQTLVYGGVTHGTEVTRQTALGRTSHYQVTRPASGETNRLVTGPDGLAMSTVETLDGQSTVRTPDGTVVSATVTGDARFSTQSPSPVAVTVTTPGGRTQTAAFSRSIQLVRASDPLSLSRETQTVAVGTRTWTATYEAVTRTHTVTSPAGRQSSVTLDERGRVVHAAAPGVAPIDVTYDASGRPLTITQGDRSVSYSYDTRGRLQTLTDPTGGRERYAYDALDRLVRQTFPDGAELGLGYDAASNLTSLTPPGRPAHAFDYDALDRGTSYTPPDAGSGAQATTQAYSLDREETRLVRPDGREISLSYGAQTGRLDRLTVSRGSFGFGYDTAGRISSVSGPGGSAAAYTYDGPLLLSASLSGPVHADLALGYDEDLRVASVSLDGDAVAYAYDDDGILVRAGSLWLAPDAASGQLTGIVLGALGERLTYDPYGDVASRTAQGPGGASLYEESYTRDAGGRIVARTEAVAGERHSFAYAYDSAGQLTQVTRDGSVLGTYAYDANGNRTLADGVAATYDAQDRLVSVGSRTYTHAASGELVVRPGQTAGTHFQYDELGQLERVDLEDGRVVEYVLDHASRRVARRENGVLQRRFVWQGRLQVAAELDAAGGLVSRFVYATRPNVPDYMVRGGVTYRILTDHLGSPRLVVRADTGEVAQRMDYDSWGRVLRDTQPGFQPFGFAGGLWDADTGLVRFGARDYDPALGRFTAKDPIGFANGLTSLYAYVGNDPVNWVDPTGLSWESALGHFTWGVGEGIVGSVLLAGLVTTGGVGGGLLAVGIIGYGAYSLATTLLQVATGRSLDGGCLSSEERLDLAAGALGGLVGGGIGAWGWGVGAEFHIPWWRGPTGKPGRVAPWGNRTGHPFGERPHYHRAIPNPARAGQSLPGQGMRNHRPWEGGW